MREQRLKAIDKTEKKADEKTKEWLMRMLLRSYCGANAVGSEEWGVRSEEQTWKKTDENLMRD